MESKRCFSCGDVKGLSDFYKHPKMKDGRLGKCKECCKAENRKNRQEKVDYYREYDRNRASDIGRVEARRKYADSHKDQIDRSKSEWRKRNRDKTKAHRKVAYEIGKGSLTAKPCELCGNEPTEAHHDDYSKPLDIIWLCDSCHKKRHKDLREQARSESPPTSRKGG